MRKSKMPTCFLNLKISGADPTEEEGESEESEDNDDDGEEGEGEEDKGKEDTTALKSALQKERRARKINERELKKLQKAINDAGDKEKSESDKAKEDASKAESKAQKLAERLKESAIDNAIIKLSSKLKFRDTDDALKLIDRDSIEVDQDEDDPTKIELDEDSVKSALESLAKLKPHLILADGQGAPSGGKFNGGRGKSQQELNDSALTERYDAFKQTGRVPSSS